MPASRRSRLLLAVAASIPLASAAQIDYTLSTTELNRTSWERQPYVANGYIGQRIPAEGFGYRQVVPINASAHDGTQGWPLFTPRQTAAIVAGFYDQQNETAGTNFAQTGGEQPISTLPTFDSLYLTINNETYSTLTPDSQIANWSQSMSINDGIVRTMLDWTPEGMNKSVSLEYTVLAHRVWPNVAAVRLSVQGLTQDMQVAFTDVLDGVGAWRTDPVSAGPVPNYTHIIHSAVRPNGISNVTAYEVSLTDAWPHSAGWTNDTGANCITQQGVLTTNASTASLCYRATHVPQNGRLDAVKYVGIASSDAYPGSELATALQAARHANATGWEAMVNQHQQAWKQVWQDADIVINGDSEEFREIQLSTRASLFHILTNLRNGSEPTGLGDTSMGPAGLTSDSYAGQVFWDSITWVAPSLFALQPDYGENIIDYYHRQLGAAEVNAREFNLSGALFPWTNARFGNCTGVGPCYDYEYHLNPDIALAAWQYFAATGNKTWLQEKGYPLIRGAADMIATFVQYNQTTGQYYTTNMTSPDEYSNHKNNSAMTNGAFAVTLQHAQEVGSMLGYDSPSNWTAIRNNITMLQAPSGILLEFDGFNGTTAVKQADVVLLEYPYEYPRSPSAALQDLDFYSIATSPNGPGMTYSIFSIIAAELSPVGCASWSYFLQSSQPYARAPYYQFSEQTSDVYAENGGTNPAYTFLTGHGGYLQTLTHGFTGYRFRTDRLYFDPILPPQFSQGYTLKGFKWQGGVYDIQVAQDNTKITWKSGGSSPNVTVEIAKGNSKAGNHTLTPGQSLTVPTRATSGALVEGNIAQCQTVLTNDTRFGLANNTIVPGEYALSAIDGANATTWQPLTTNKTSMTIDLTSLRTIKGFHMNWGPEPPTTFSISIANSSSDVAAAMSSPVASGNVSISAPFNVQAANQVAIQIGNLTDASLPQPVYARYVSLTVEGNQFPGAKYGPTVAEFAVLGA
ncbi:alpha,alpha-trehalase ath1 [Rhodotorula toruloides]